MGDQGDGAYSAGVSLSTVLILLSSRPPSCGPRLIVILQRGGAGNIESPRTKPTKPGSTHDSDVIPETALHEPASEHEAYHVGRGGQGNVHKEEDAATHKGFADKLKEMMFKKNGK